MNGGAARKIKVSLAHVCALVVGGYFIYAAAGKIVEPRQFAIDIRNYRILPDVLLHLPALFLPWWEVAAAVMLIVPKTRRAGTILICGLLLVFIAMIGYSAIHKGLDISCGCTGKNSSHAGWLTIGRNVLLLIASLYSLYGLRWVQRSARFPAPSEQAIPARAPAG
ncbi:MAG: MauE/DoxX family redox-associated membrane protein [Planctomycetota bacterium]